MQAGSISLYSYKKWWSEAVVVCCFALVYLMRFKCSIPVQMADLKRAIDPTR